MPRVLAKAACAARVRSTCGSDKIGIGDDAVREAAAARSIGDALQPAGLLDGEIVGDLGLEMDRLDQLDRCGIRHEIGQQIVAAERRGVADQARDGGGGEPGIGMQIAIPEMMVGVDDAHPTGSLVAGEDVVLAAVLLDERPSRR